MQKCATLEHPTLDDAFSKWVWEVENQQLAMI
jgi:hypothetical protein